MSPKSDVPPFAVDDAMIDRAAESLDIAGRLAGRNGLLLMDVACSSTMIIDPPLDYLAQAMVGLHRNIQDDDDLSDIEEALEDPCARPTSTASTRLATSIEPFGQPAKVRTRPHGRTCTPDGFAQGRSYIT